MRLKHFFTSFFLLFLLMVVIANCSNSNRANSSNSKSWVGKNVTFQETISIQGSSGSMLVDLVAKDVMKSEYLVTYTAVVEAELGESLKVIIKDYEIKMKTKSGRTSIAQHQNFPQARSMASKMIGETRVKEKTIVTKIK